MGNNKYDRHSIHQQYLFHHKSILLPMFCRLSIKDIRLNNQRKDPISTEEPSSPKVSCMGQVKRNNRVIAAHKYSKLKKLFSSKTLLPPTKVTTTSGKSSRENVTSRLKLKNEDSVIRMVNIGELDPPLPVVNKVPREVNLWNRRFNNGKALQIQHICLPNSNSQPPTVSHSY